MSYLTKQQAREAARKGFPQMEVLGSAVRSKANEVLARRAGVVSDSDRFDVFLSHSHLDADLVLGAAKLLERQQLSVYVDWVVDHNASKTPTTGKHAKMVRTRMRQSNSLLYLCTDNILMSRWTPWELGYFDAYRGTVAILPLLDGEDDQFAGSEYLEIYPAIKLEDLSMWRLLKDAGQVKSSGPRLLVEGAGLAATDINRWVSKT